MLNYLKSLLPPNGKITPRRVTGTSARYQRLLAVAIKKRTVHGLTSILPRLILLDMNIN